MASHIVTFKMHPKLKFNVRCEAERLLASGMSVEDAARAIADEDRCGYRDALNQVQYVNVYKWSKYSKK
jgi:uncharacterized membrane protein